MANPETNPSVVQEDLTAITNYRQKIDAILFARAAKMISIYGRMMALEIAEDNVDALKMVKHTEAYAYWSAIREFIKENGKS